MDISMANLLIAPLNQTTNVAHSVKNICGICNGLHYTGLCNELTDKIIPDKPHSENLSRYSVPDGLMVIDDYGEPKKSMVITAQKFAKGTRFGPVLAPKSYVPPSRPNKFPLVIFNEIWHGDPFIDDLSDDIKELFNVRNYYLDTSDENKCNWMIHVDIARYSNEQNLMAYQENDQIYYTSTRDIELGDILKVWYSPSYATRMGVSLLQEAANEYSLCTNVRQVSTFELNDDKHTDMTNNNYLSIAPTTSSPSSEISLPPVNSLMKSSQNHSPSYNIDFDNLILMAKNEQQMGSSGGGMSSYQMDFIDNYNLSSISDVDKMSQSSSSSIKPIKFTEMNEAETQKFACELCTRKYITKSNLEKHMRSHDLFMCVVCMKMFQNPEELKEHDCFKQKSSAKKSLFHCGICWKVLSNSWSLNRHMKIHRNITMTPDTSSQEKSDDVSDEILSTVTNQNLLIQEPELYTIESHCDISNDMDEKPIESMSHDALIGGFITDPLDVHAWAEPISQQDSLLHDQDLSTHDPPQFDFEEQLNQESQINHHQQQNYHNDDEQQHNMQHEIIQSIQMQAIEEMKSSVPNYDKCIVCSRAFKNPNSLEKHLRNVHTAHIVRPELTTSIKKSSEYRRIVLNKKPIKENVAKALVSKLNKKNQQHHNHEQAANEQSQINAQFTQNTPATAAAIVADATWNGNGLAPISAASDKQTTSAHIENGGGNTIIIISNVELNPANSSNGYTFANYHQAALPKLVPISGLKTQAAVTTTIATTSNSTFDISPKHDTSNEANSFAEIGEKFPNTSPKVFIIDKSNGEHSKSSSSHQKQPKVQILSQDDPNEQHQCPECEKVFQKKYQLKRHQEIHENLFYFCPFCKRSPVKARSSLRKHFIKDHSEHQETWQASNFMSTLLKKYEKIKKSSHESHDSTKKYKKEGKKEAKKKKEKLVIELNDTSIDNNNHHNHRCEIINDQPLPQVSIDDTDAEETHQQQQIILSNLFLDPITLDEENNLIKYTLAGEDDFIMNGHNGETSVVNAGSIESYEMSEFSNFKSSFDEIQEKLDAELEFNNDQMIKWSDELDDSSSVLSSQSTSNLSASDIGKTLGKQKNGFMLT